MPQQEINQTMFIDLAKISANSNTLLNNKRSNSFGVTPKNSIEIRL